MGQLDMQTTLSDTELAGMSQNFRDFYKSMLDWDLHEGGQQIDSDALIALEGAERELAENLLIERIESDGSSVILALGDMKSQRGAVALKEYTETMGGEMAVNISMALWKIEKWPFAQRMLIDVLEGRRTSRFDSATVATGRAAAATELTEFPGPLSTAALRRALNDPDSLVRYWAQGSLNYLERLQGGEFYSTDDTSNAPENFWSGANRWRVVLIISVLIHVGVLVATPSIQVPPRLSGQVLKILWAEMVLVIPFLWSVYVLLRYRGREERVIGYLSLAGSLIWLADGVSILAAM